MLIGFTKSGVVNVGCTIIIRWSGPLDVIEVRLIVK